MTFILTHRRASNRVFTSSAGFSAADVLALLQATPVATVQGIGTIPTSYEAMFDRYAQIHWDSYGPAVLAGGTIQGEGGGNYYDRAKMYYREWARTGNSAYLTRANAHVEDYMTNYLTSTGLSSFTLWQWTFPTSLYIYDMLNGVNTGRNWIRDIADKAASSGYLTLLTGPSVDNDGVDTRVAARITETIVWAKWLGLTSATGRNYTTDMTTAMAGMMTRQDSDGAIRGFGGNYHNKSFMVGLFVETLVTYLEHVNSDATLTPSGAPRSIQSAITLAADYLYSNHWVPQEGGFYYVDGASDNGGIESNQCNNALNMMVAGIFWMAYYLTSTTSYRDKGDRAFIEGMNHGDWSQQLAWQSLSANKSFNEFFSFLHRYWHYRGTAAMVNSSRNRVVYPFDMLVPDNLSSGYSGLSVTQGSSAVTDLGAGTASDGVAHAWRLTMTGSGTQYRLATSPWNDKIKGRYAIRARKPTVSGASAVYLGITDSSGNFTVGPTKFTLASDNSWNILEIVDTVLHDATSTNQQIELYIGDNSDATCAGRVEVDYMYLGVGATEVTNALVPVRMVSTTGTSDPTITRSGTTYTLASNGTWLRSPSSFTRRWLQDGLPIGGQTGTTYTGGTSGHYISCEVTAINAAGSSTPLRSNLILAP